MLFFDEPDAEWFFGREALTERLVDRMSALAAGPPPRLLAVVGASGSGKSSLVRAGLAVALKRAGWDTHVFTPTADALKSLSPLTAQAPKVGRPTPIAWLVDQLEEVFTLCRSEAARASFVDRLLAAANEPGGPTTVVLALRADFYVHCAAFPRLRQAIAGQQEFIGQMSEEELRHAIQEPARRGGWEFEPGLVDIMLRDIGAGGAQEQEPGALPLLSHALLATWERRRGRTLTLDGYRASGGVRGAIAETAESVFADRLDEQQRQHARNIFMRLTELGEGTEDTRRRAALTELVPNVAAAAELRSVLNTLSDARLVILGEDSAEVAHEALIREWQRLREWLNHDRDGLRLHRHLTEAAREWQALQHDPGALYRGARLAQALEWTAANPDALNEQERAFLNASKEMAEGEATEREQQRRRELEVAQRLAEEQRRRAEEQSSSARQLRKRGYFLASAFALAIVLAAIALFSGEQARLSAITAKDNEDRAEQQGQIGFARELAAMALSNLEAHPERSILLALQAVTIGRRLGGTALREPEEALHRAVAASRLRFTLRGHTKSVSGVAFSPDGSRLATFSYDGSAKIWDAATGRELFTVTTELASWGTDAIHAVAFSPDGRLLATATTGDGDNVSLWDVSTGTPLPIRFCCHANTITSVVFSPDGSRLATASQDSTAKIWDVRTGKEVLTLSGHSNFLTNVAFSPDGRRVATAGIDRKAIVWDADKGTALLTLQGHGDIIEGVAFSPDSQRLVTASRDHTAQVWELGPSREWLTLSTDLIWGFSLSGDGKRVAAAHAGGIVDVWEAADGRLTVALPRTGWDKAKGIDTNDIAFSPDGSRLVRGSSSAKSAQVWDVKTGKPLLELTGHRKGILRVAYSSDGKQIATASYDRTTKTWDAVTGNGIFTLPDPQGQEAQGVAFSPDENLIATSSLSVTLWDAHTGKSKHFMTGHSALVFGLAFSPDSKRLVTGSRDGTAKIWDVATGGELFTLSGHTSTVFGVAFSHDGTRIATASYDATAKLWDASTGKELLTLYAHTKGLDGIAFTPDDARLITSSEDGTVRIYLLRIEDLIELARTRLTRTWTTAKCQKFLHVEPCPADPLPSAGVP